MPIIFHLALLKLKKQDAISFVALAGSVFLIISIGGMYLSLQFSGLKICLMRKTEF